MSGLEGCGIINLHLRDPSLADFNYRYIIIDKGIRKLSKLNQRIYRLQ
jgi:hypothetical protein